MDREEELTKGLTLRTSTPMGPHPGALTTELSTRKRPQFHLQREAKNLVTLRKVLRQEVTDERCSQLTMTTATVIPPTSSQEGATGKAEVAIRQLVEVTTIVSTTRRELRPSASTPQPTKVIVTTRATTTSKVGVVRMPSMVAIVEVSTLGVMQMSIIRVASKPAVAMATLGSNQSTRRGEVHTRQVAPTVVELKRT